MSAPTPAESCPRWTLDDPLAFARDLHGYLATMDDAGCDPRLTEPAPHEYAAYRAARAKAGYDGHQGLTPIVVMDEAAHAWAGCCHDAGIEFGVFAERVRRELLALDRGPRVWWLKEGNAEPAEETTGDAA